MPRFETINVPISLGSNELNPINAYFLGAILSADEPQIDNGKKIWLAPYRHNYGGTANDSNIGVHIKFIKSLIKRCNGKILLKKTLTDKRWFPSNKQGFAVAFESPIETSIDDIIAPLETLIPTVDLEIARCFLVGAFDGRSSVDHDKKNNKVRYLTLDCTNERVAALLNTALDRLGLGANNYNTSRDRLEGGLPRKNQFRIPADDAKIFIQKVGMICPSRFDQLKGIYSSLHETQEYALLNGLKTLSTAYTVTPSTTEDFSEEVEFQADQELFSEINEQILESLETDTTFEYSGRPQAKQEPVFVNGHKSYKRDKKKSVNALKKAHHRCEIDGTHPSFVRRNSSQNYTEPHHLVPMGFSDRFEVSLDVEENIVSLCSNCHNQLHYGRDVRHLLDTLFALRKDLLKSAGIEITIEELYEMYDA